MSHDEKTLGGALAACGTGALLGSIGNGPGAALGCGLMAYAYMNTDCAPVEETRADTPTPSSGDRIPDTSTPGDKPSNEWRRFVITLTAESVSGSIATMIYSTEQLAWQNDSDFEGHAVTDPACFPEDAEGAFPDFDLMLRDSLVQGAYNATTGDFNLSLFYKNDFNEMGGCRLAFAEGSEESCRINISRDNELVYETPEACELTAQLDASGQGDGILVVGEQMATNAAGETVEIVQIRASVQGEELRGN